MKIVKDMLASLVVFILGLEIGGFGMWYLCMSILNEPRSRKRTSRQRISYADWED